MIANEQPASNATCDVAIIGAGPSGLAAAALLREHGVGVTIIDEQQRAGGGHALLSAKLHDCVKAALHAVNERRDIDWRFQSTVLGIMRPSPYRTQRADAHASRNTLAGPAQRLREGSAHELWIQGPTGSYLLRASTVLLAPGCYERPLAFPGWTLPGVTSAGASQSQQLVPGHRFLLAGSHPLQLAVADQLLSAGVRVAAVVFTQQQQPAWLMLRHPLVALGHHRQLFETSNILGRLRRARVPVIWGKTIIRADGVNAVERATIAGIDANGIIDPHKTQVFECDRIGICHGFLASSELVRQAGAQVHWKDHAGGWLARHDEWFESSMGNLFVAGEITSVDGAEAALAKGRIAAAGILRSLGRVDDSQAHRLAERARARLSRLQSFATVLHEFARPPASLALQTMSDDTILCRCESIKRGELTRALAENKHIHTADAAKLLTRAGMGLCQGRMCGDNVARVIAEARAAQASEVGPFQAQAPVKPVPLATLLRGRCG